MFAQDAAADDLGHSAACAGLIGPGGQLEVAAVDVPVCTIDAPSGPAGLIVNLTGLGLFRVRADAVYGQCTADASGAVVGTAHIADIVLDVGVNLGLLGTVFFPIATIPAQVPAPNTVVPLSVLGAVAKITLNEQPVPQAPGTIELTAAHIEVLPLGADPLLDLEIGRVECGRNTVATATIDFDTSGDLGGDTIQPQTENAFRMSYNSAVNRPAVTLVGRVPLDGDVTVDVARGLPAGCTLSIDGTSDPDAQVVVCPVGAVTAGNTVNRIIPVEVNAAATSPIAATMQVFGGSLSEILSSPLTEEEDLLVESTEVSGNSGGLAVPDPNRTGLPNDITGTLRISAPQHVAEAAYGGTPCAVEVFNPPAAVYPAIAGNKIFNCGSSIAPPSVAALAFTYAPGAPVTGDGDPALGRVLIIRGGPGANPQEIVNNSYYADLDVPGAASGCHDDDQHVDEHLHQHEHVDHDHVDPGHHVHDGRDDVDHGGVHDHDHGPRRPPRPRPAAATTTTTAPAATTTSTTAASTTSTTAAASTTSSTAKVLATTTSKAPLAKTGTDSTATAAIAMGLLGVGMVITGRGMQVEANGLDRRRRRR